MSFRVRALFRALANANSPDPRFFAQIIDGYQFSGESHEPQGDENLKFALKLRSMGEYPMHPSQQMAKVDASPHSVSLHYRYIRPSLNWEIKYALKVGGNEYTPSVRGPKSGCEDFAYRHSRSATTR